MSWRPLQSLFVIIVTSVAANHQGVHCDCASQGPWQPLFKPSQILHSEFPEHKYSSSTGGAKAVKIRHFKLVPHLVVPVVNPVAYSIQQHDGQGNHLDDNERFKVSKTKAGYVKKNTKNIHYHYSFPDPNDHNQPTSKFSDSLPTPTPSDSNYLSNNYGGNDGHEQNLSSNEQNSQNSYDDSSHHSHENESSYFGTSSTPLENSHESSGAQHDSLYSQEDQSTYNSYGSGERNDAIYDSSKLSSDFKPKPKDYPVYKHAPSQTEGDKENNNFNYYRGNDNEIDIRIKNRGKSIYIPVYRITDPSNMILKKPENSLTSSFSNPQSNPDNIEPVVLPTHTTKYQSNRPSLPLPIIYHSPPHHQKELPQTHSTSMFKNHLQSMPIPLVHPPFSIYNPWRFLLNNDAQQISVMRPPAPGLPDTWNTLTAAGSSNHLSIIPTKLKMTGVIYPIKKFHIQKRIDR